MRLIVIDEETGEPLTIVEVPASMMRAIWKGLHPRRLFLPVENEPSIFDTPPGPIDPTLKGYIVSLRLEPVFQGRDGRLLYWHAFPDDSTLALRLRAAFLPGQMGEVEREREAAWFRGLLQGARL